MRTADPVYRARLVALLQVERSREELIRRANLPSEKAFERIMKTIKTLTIGSKNVKYQNDDGRRAEL